MRGKINDVVRCVYKPNLDVSYIKIRQNKCLKSIIVFNSSPVTPLSVQNKIFIHNRIDSSLRIRLSKRVLVESTNTLMYDFSTSDIDKR
jgi:hypothetical protein